MRQYARLDDNRRVAGGVTPRRSNRTRLGGGHPVHSRRREPQDPRLQFEVATPEVAGQATADIMDTDGANRDSTNNTWCPRQDSNLRRPA
jgi:hypothetical protein